MDFRKKVMENISEEQYLQTIQTLEQIIMNVPIRIFYLGRPCFFLFSLKSGLNIILFLWDIVISFHFE